MEARSITELYKADFILTNIFSMRQNWQKVCRFTMDHPRPTDALLYFPNCRGIYEMPNQKEKAEVPRGSILYIPHGARYKSVFADTDEKSDTHTVLFEFLPKGADGKTIAVSESESPFLVEHGGGAEIYDGFFRLADAYKSMNRSPSYIKSLAYGIIAELSRSEYIAKLSSKRYSVISHGIVYLEENYDKNPSVSELADMCSVSESTFRELFKSYSGLSPHDYITKARIERAKKLLADGVMTVSELAYSLGFGDTSSFGRFFKGEVGVSPGEWRKNKCK